MKENNIFVRNSQIWAYTSIYVARGCFYLHESHRSHNVKYIVNLHLPLAIDRDMIAVITSALAGHGQ